MGWKPQTEIPFLDNFNTTTDDLPNDSKLGWISVRSTLRQPAVPVRIIDYGGRAVLTARGKSPGNNARPPR